MLRTLLSRSLIEAQGCWGAVGRPILFETPFEFWHFFGRSRVEALPPLPEALVAEVAASEAQGVASVEEKSASA